MAQNRQALIKVEEGRMSMARIVSWCGAGATAAAFFAIIGLSAVQIMSKPIQVVSNDGRHCLKEVEFYLTGELKREAVCDTFSKGIIQRMTAEQFEKLSR